MALRVDNFKVCTRDSKDTTPYQGSKCAIGLFICRDCFFRWKSTESRANEGELCRCGKYVYPFKQLPLDPCDRKPPPPNPQNRFAQQYIDINCLRINWNANKTAGWVEEWQLDDNDVDNEETSGDEDDDDDDSEDEVDADGNELSEDEDLEMEDRFRDNNDNNVASIRRKYSGQRLVIPPSILSKKLKKLK